MTPEIAELLRTGKLHPFDADWIGRLKPEHQLAAARKCMKPNFCVRNNEPSRSTIKTGRR